MDKINIVITDDHKLFRRGIQSIIEDFDFVDEIGEAENGIELLELLKESEPKPDVVLLDIKMPEMDGIETTEKLKELFSDVKILILTMEDDEQIILHLVSCGVNGYLLKNAEPDELETALLRLMTNDFYFPSNISDIVLRNIHYKKKDSNKFASGLSEREIQVLELICKENTAQEIAEILCISKRTVESHKRNLLEKTGTKNMAGLVVYALKNRIVEI